MSFNLFSHWYDIPKHLYLQLKHFWESSQNSTHFAKRCSSSGETSFYWLLGRLISQHVYSYNNHIYTKLTSPDWLIIEYIPVYIYVYLRILYAQVHTIQITVLDSDPINYIIISVMSHVKLPHKSDTLTWYIT